MRVQRSNAPAKQYMVVVRVVVLRADVKYVITYVARPTLTPSPLLLPPPSTGVAAGGSGAKNAAAAEDPEQHCARLQRVQPRQPQHAGAAHPAAA